VAFATLSGIDVGRWKQVSDWSARVQALPRFAAPFDLLSMADAEFDETAAQPDRSAGQSPGR